MLVYNVQDANYYDCAETTYTAGYFAPEYANSIGMNVIVIDAFDWANRVGPDDSEWRDDDPSNDQATLYEGVVAHELEHLLHSYSDPGELSWVDEGLADFAVVPQRLRRHRVAPHVPPGVLRRHVPHPLGRWAPELRCGLYVLPVPLGAGGWQR